MDNHTEISNQYGKLSSLYKTIIYLQEEATKEHAILEKLKEKNGSKKVKEENFCEGDMRDHFTKAQINKEEK